MEGLQERNDKMQQQLHIMTEKAARTELELGAVQKKQEIENHKTCVSSNVTLGTNFVQLRFRH